MADNNSIKISNPITTSRNDGGNAPTPTHRPPTPPPRKSNNGNNH